jgi:hypothetical protein
MGQKIPFAVRSDRQMKVIMSSQLSQKTHARITTVMRFCIATGEDLEAAKAFDKTVCKALDIAPEVKPPTFLADPLVLD